jgi:hypothetical protein
MALLPTKAFEGTASWSAGGYYIATGCSTSVEALGAEKEKDIESCFEKGHAQEAVQIYYRVYHESNEPDRVVLDRLAELCEQTHRDESARAFRNEVSRLWPESVKP